MASQTHPASEDHTKNWNLGLWFEVQHSFHGRTSLGAFILKTEMRSLFQFDSLAFFWSVNTDKFRRNGSILAHLGTSKKDQDCHCDDHVFTLPP